MSSSIIFFAEYAQCSFELRALSFELREVGSIYLAKTRYLWAMITICRMELKQKKLRIAQQ